ncbi:hypothetical protein BH18THE2_BH18THE2_28820 [soil metagenome]|jgi:hypothetical protein
MDMSAEPSRLTDDERKKLTRIPDNVETRDMLDNLNTLWQVSTNHHVILRVYLSSIVV